MPSNTAAAPRVSVIIPAYRVSDYIAETLESALAQTFTDYEIVVVNDGCPDTAKLEQALAPYRDRIVYIKQENRGLSGARNTAVRAARGSLVALLDGDDIWEPDYLAVQVAEFDKHPGLAVLYPNAITFGSRDAGRLFMDSCPSEGEVTFERLINAECTVMVSCLVRRDAIIRAGMFDESLRSVEDFDMWVRIAKQGGRIAYHRQVLVRYRQRPDSLSANRVRMAKSMLQALGKLEHDPTLTPAERETVVNRRLYVQAQLRLEEARYAFFQRNWAVAVRCARDANTFFRSRKLSCVVFLLNTAPALLLLAYELRDRLVFKADTRF